MLPCQDRRRLDNFVLSVGCELCAESDGKKLYNTGHLAFAQIGAHYFVPIGNGNFIKGYTLKRKTSPGKHTISVWAPTGIISTTFEFEVYQDKRYRIEMDYILHKKDGIYDVFAEKIEEQ